MILIKTRFLNVKTTSIGIKPDRCFSAPSQAHHLSTLRRNLESKSLGFLSCFHVTWQFVLDINCRHQSHHQTRFWLVWGGCSFFPGLTVGINKSIDYLSFDPESSGEFDEQVWHHPSCVLKGHDSPASLAGISVTRLPGEFGQRYPLGISSSLEIIC